MLRILSGGLLVLLTGGWINAAAAQRVETTLDAGATGIQYSDSISILAATLSPAMSLESGRTTLDASGSISQLNTNAWTAQASLDASSFSPLIATLRGELSGSAGGSAHQDGTRTGQLDAVGRIHLMRGNWGVWVGAGGGGAWDGSARHGLVLADLGAWMRRGPVTAVLTALPTAIDDSLRYTDIDVAVRLLRSRAEIGATLGARAGHGLIAGSTSWGTVGGVLWLTSHIGVVASAGAYPPDIAQGFPNARYFSLAVRVDNQRRRRSGVSDDAMDAENRTVRRDSGDVAGDAVVETFAVEGSTGERTIRVHARRAKRVELSGDITNWTPVVLTSTGDGWWAVVLSVPRGAHQVSLRLDGGQWRAPPGLVTVTDESGGSAGVWNAP